MHGKLTKANFLSPFQCKVGVPGLFWPPGTEWKNAVLSRQQAKVGRPRASQNTQGNKGGNDRPTRCKVISRQRGQQWIGSLERIDWVQYHILCGIQGYRDSLREHLSNSQAANIFLKSCTQSEISPFIDHLVIFYPTPRSVTVTRATPPW